MGNSFRWDTEWYAPDLASFVLLDRRERYQPNRARIMADAPGNWFVLQLESFKRG
jgi:hypothetical protein